VKTQLSDKQAAILPGTLVLQKRNIPEPILFHFVKEKIQPELMPGRLQLTESGNSEN
jgi:hypothetical protein